MHTTGMVLVSFGAILACGSAVALACTNSEKSPSVGSILDMVVLGGILTSIRDLFRGISAGMMDRSSVAFPPLVLLGMGIALLLGGCSLIGVEDSQQPSSQAPSAPAEPAVPSGGDKPPK